MKRLKALGKRTKHNYERVLERAFGGREPDFVPDLSRGGRGGGVWPEPSRATLRAAIVRHWAMRGDVERGEKLAARIEAVEVEHSEKAEPSEEETRRFEKVLRKREAAGEKAATLCFLGMQTGARSEELLSLTQETLESALAYGRLELDGKGRKKRLVPVFDRTKEVLRQLFKLRANLPHDKQEADRKYDGAAPRWSRLGELLAAPGSTLATQYNLFNRYVKDVAAEARLEGAAWSPHTLRQIYATRLTRGGAPISVVQKALGHAFVSTTQRYIKVKVEDIGQFGKFV